jgi:imidazole glycerol-phosphate synthase subunit HisF
MLKKRVIFTLLYEEGSFVLSRNFRLQKVGDIKWLLKNYDFSQLAFSIDELVVLDVSRANRDLDRFCETIKVLTEGCFVPISAGGGIRNVHEAKRILRSGADKVVLNTALHTDLDSVWDIAREFGRQCIIASVDINKGNKVWVENGTKALKTGAKEWIREVVEEFPVGELYLNSMERDGTGQGYLFDLLDLLPDKIDMPVIIAGGAGKYDHFVHGLNNADVDAVATAHLFNFIGNGLELARIGLLSEGILLPHWDSKLAAQLKGIYSSNKFISEKL